MKSIVTTLGLAGILALPVFGQSAETPVKSAGAAAGKAADVAKAKNKAIQAGQSAKAQSQTGVKASGGNSWFPVTVRDLGTFYGQGEALGVFEFENPHDNEIEWRAFDPSCQCAKAEIRIGDRIYRVIAKPQKRLVRVTKREGQPDKLENVRSITIGPKEKGEIETRLEMRNIVGPKSATLDIHGTDPVEPHSRLTFRAKGAQLFSISPKEINLNKMTWNETREFSVTVSSSMSTEWNIRRMDDAGDAFDVTWEKVERSGATAYKISGKYSPKGVGKTSSGGVLKFHTDVNGSASFSVRVLAFVQGPLDVKPGGFLTMGLIRRGKSASKTVEFTPNDNTDLQATEMTFEKVSLKGDFLKAVSRKEGKKLIVELQVAENAPTGLVKGELVVKLNHPLIKEKRIMFNGFVR